MNNELVDLIAEKLAQAELERQSTKSKRMHKVVPTITELHRKKARIAIEMMEAFRSNSDK